MNFYSFKVIDINGNPHDLSQYKGKKVLVVNTASECGLTPQFEQLESLYKNYAKQSFAVIGFPSNDFGAQDPGSNEEIASFCQMNYGVTFPMMEKIVVLGENAHPLYKWMKEQAHTEVKWNFHKFLIDEEGQVFKDVDPTSLPLEEEIIKWVTNSL